MANEVNSKGETFEQFRDRMAAQSFSTVADGSAYVVPVAATFEGMVEHDGETFALYSGVIF